MEPSSMSVANMGAIQSWRLWGFTPSDKEERGENPFIWRGGVEGPNNFLGQEVTRVLVH